MKQCNRCGESKPLSEYHVSRKAKSGNPVYKSICKTCHQEYARKRKAIREDRSAEATLTFEELQEQRRPKREAKQKSNTAKRANRQAARQALLDEFGGREWMEKLRQCAKKPSNQDSGWMAKIRSAVKESHRMPAKGLKKPVTCETWADAMKVTITRLKARLTARNAALDPWKAKAYSLSQDRKSR